MNKHTTISLCIASLGFLLATSDLAFAAADLFVADRDGRIQRFSPSGAGSTFANTSLSNPYGLAFDESGNLFAANGDGTIVKFTLDGTSSVFASLGSFSRPTGLAFDSVGNLFVARFNGTILRITPSGTQSTFVSSGPFQVYDIAFDSLGNLYTTSSRNSPATGTIEKITPGGVVTTFASGLVAPRGLALDTQDNIFVANSGVNTIVKFTPTGSSSVFAGVPNTTNNGLTNPFGLAFDDSGHLYAANGGLGGNPGSIERFAPNGTHSLFATTLSGSPTDVAFAIPEPSTALSFLAGAALCMRRRLCRI